MTSTRVSFIAAIATVLLWGLKAVAIGSAGGLGESPAEGPFFFAGLAAALVASAALGVSAAARRGRAARVGAGVLAPVLVLAVGGAADRLVQLFLPFTDERHWVWAEVSLWAVSLGLLAASLRLQRRHRDAGAADPVPAVVTAR